MQQGNETILSINLNKLEKNFYYLKNKIKEKTKIIAVVKAFAYGHGDVVISKKLEELNIYALWVTDFEEGILLRKSGVKTKIIVANPGIKSYDQIIKHKLDVVIYNMKLLELYAKNKNKVNIHIKINTGMNRYGFNEEELLDASIILEKNKHLNIISICSHLACSDNINKKHFTKSQLKYFTKTSKKFENTINKSVYKHILNTHGVINFPDYQMDMVRLGIGLYGSAKDKSIIPISSLKSVVTQNRNIKTGESIGYGEGFIAEKNMNISIVPVGYADGLNRRLGNGIGKVMINNTICSIIGKISMGSFAVDTSKIIVQEGDSVEIFGDNISVANIANRIGTVPYEIYSTLNRRLKRIYIN